MRFLALLLTVLTGATGLVYEVTWQRYLATLLGSHAEATVAVLGLFLAGLSGGYALFGRVARRLAGSPAQLLRRYGAVELGIGVWAWAFPTLIGGARAFSLHLPLEGAPGFMADVAVSALLLLPPTLLMGGTIPMLTQALAPDLERATRLHAWIYGLNALGAVGGALGAAFVGIPRLGLARLLYAAGAVNALAGLGFVAVAALAPREAPAPSPAAPASPPAPRVRAEWIAAAGLLGFGMMTLQVALNRIAALAMGATPFAFAMVVTLFVGCIALGSLLVAAVPRIPRASAVVVLAALAAWLYGVDGRIDQAPFAAHLVRTASSTTDLAFYAFHAHLLLLLLASFGPAIALSGAALPLFFHALRTTGDALGEAAGSLYSWNTVGSLLGAVLGGYAAFFVLDLQGVYRLAWVSVAISALVVATRVFALPRLAAVVAAASVVAASLVMPPWNATYLESGIYRQRTPLPVEPYDVEHATRAWAGDMVMRGLADDPIASIAVKEQHFPGGGSQLCVFTNGKPDSATVTDRPTTGLLALLPALVADRFERVFVVGWGSGVTVGELVALHTTRQVEVAEISRGVIALAPLFEEATGAALESPKLALRIGDAYRTLLRSPGGFDAIVSEPSNPWVAGVEMLFSREFLELARDRLAPGGVYVQWYHQYESDDATLDLVLRTYASVFGDVAVWYGMGPDLLLLGFPQPGGGVDLARLLERVRRPDLAAGLGRSGLRGPLALLAHEAIPAGVVTPALVPGALHSLDHPLLADCAARAYFRGGMGNLPYTGAGEAARIGHRNSLIRQLLAARGGALAPDEWQELTDEACTHRAQICGALLAEWALSEPDSPQRAEAMARLPARAQPYVGGRVLPAHVQELAALLREPAGGTGAVTPGQALRAAQVAAAFQYAAIDLDAEPVLSQWERCDAPPRAPDACRELRAQAEALLSPPSARATAR